MRIYVQLVDTDVDYLFDSASLTEMPGNNNWKNEALARIDSLRKTDIYIM